MFWECGADAGEGKAGAAYPAGPNAGDFDPLSLEAIAAKSAKTGGPIGAETSINPQGAGPGFATHICDLEVHKETGHVKILRYTATHDVGRAIPPSSLQRPVHRAPAPS